MSLAAKLAYYNEIDPYAASWLRELIKAGHIPAGDVDERSIEDVRPDELAGYAQCHFFAGIGGWPLALRNAGWPDHRPVWTGSCPCQPFSAAGQGAGFTDERHLWPAFHWHIQQQKPGVVFGEQVASKDAEYWLDLVQTDLEALGYAFGAVAFPAASVGAPHIRDRVYWMGYRDNPGPQRHTGNDRKALGLWQGAERPVTASSVSGGVAYTSSQHPGPACDRERSGDSCGEGQACELCGYEFDVETLGIYGCPNCEGEGLGCVKSAGPVNGVWSDSDWLLCRDGKWRPVESGTFPLADGISARVGRLRGYGNAIVPEQARVFIESVMGVIA
jgi:DNA (cytosine-5)-methyltransferase 1